MTLRDLDHFTRDQGSGRGSPGTRSSGAQAQLAEKLLRLDRAQEDRPMFGRGGHDCHSPPSKEIDAIGSVVRTPQVLARRILPDAPQRPIARQMIQPDAGQRLAVAMMREQLWLVHGHNSGGVTLRAGRRAVGGRIRSSPLVKRSSASGGGHAIPVLPSCGCSGGSGPSRFLCCRETRCTSCSSS
jgi:hypothetical protein